MNCKKFDVLIEVSSMEIQAVHEIQNHENRYRPLLSGKQILHDFNALLDMKMTQQGCKVARVLTTKWSRNCSAPLTERSAHFLELLTPRRSQT